MALDESELYDPLAGPDALYINLEREFKLAEQSYGTDHLDLVLAKGYLCKLLANARVLRYLAQHHQEILTESRGSRIWKRLRPEQGLPGRTACVRDGCRWGPGPDKRGDRRRRRTVGRIERGGGDGGEPARSPPGRPS